MDYEPDEREAEVLEVIRRENRVNPMRVREETDLRKQYVNDALRGLQKAGVVRKVNRGLYEHVPENDDEYEQDDHGADDRRSEVTPRELLDDWLWEHYDLGIDALEERLADTDHSVAELLDDVKDAKTWADRADQHLSDGDPASAEDAIANVQRILEEVLDGDAE